MFISVFLVICTGYISKKINIQEPLNILRWIIIIYAALGFISIFVGMAVYESYIERATGPYWWSYLLILFCSSLLPFILLHKKLRSKKYLILIISFAMNLGWLFERMVIIAISLHRDYDTPDNTISWLNLIPLDLILFGTTIGVLALLTGNFISRNNRALVLNKN